MNTRKLKQIMKARKINQTKLAHIMHTDKSTISNKLAGRRSFSLEDVKTLQVIFNLSNDDVCNIFLK